MRNFEDLYFFAHHCEFREVKSIKNGGFTYHINHCRKKNKVCDSMFACREFEEKKPKAPEKMYSDKIAEDLKKLSAIGAKEIAADMERLARERTLLLKYMEKKCETCAANYMAGMEECMGCVNCSNWEWNGK